MYFGIYEEICEYVVWCIQHSAAGYRPRKAVEDFYHLNMPRDVGAEFSLLNVDVANVDLSVLFSDRLLYQIRIKDLMNVPNCQLNTAFVPSAIFRIELAHTQSHAGVDSL
jgi:hypothetical protein